MLQCFVGSLPVSETSKKGESVSPSYSHLRNSLTRGQLQQTIGLEIMCPLPLFRNTYQRCQKIKLPFRGSEISRQLVRTVGDMV